MYSKTGRLYSELLTRGGRSGATLDKIKIAGDL
jgi:hypothetical protein